MAGRRDSRRRYPVLDGRIAAGGCQGGDRDSDTPRPERDQQRRRVSRGPEGFRPTNKTTATNGAAEFSEALKGFGPSLLSVLDAMRRSRECRVRTVGTSGAETRGAEGAANKHISGETYGAFAPGGE